MLPASFRFYDALAAGRSGWARGFRAGFRAACANGDAAGQKEIAILARVAHFTSRRRPADPSSMENEQVRNLYPLRGRKESHQRFFDSLGIVAVRESQPVGDAKHVAIDRKTRNAERVTENHVCGLAANSRQFRQRFHARRDLGTVVIDEGARHSDQGLCLLAKEPGRFDRLLQLAGIGIRERLCVCVSGKQRRCDLIDTLVARLRGEDGGNEQLERRAVVKLRIGVWMMALERIENALCDRLRLQCTGPFDSTGGVWDSEKMRRFSCSAAMSVGMNWTGITTRALIGARTI